MNCDLWPYVWLVYSRVVSNQVRVIVSLVWCIKIMIVFNIISTDFVLISANVCIIKNDPSFDRTEDRATLFLKLMDFNFDIKIVQFYVNTLITNLL